MEGKVPILACFLSLFSLQAEISPSSPRIEKAMGVALGESFGETTRNYVHFIDTSRTALFSVDTATGQIVAGTKLRGVPGYAALMCVSRDNSKLFVPLSSAQRIQVLSLPDLSTVDILHVSFSPQCLAMAANDIIYTLDGAAVRAVDSITGKTLSQSGTFYGTLIKIDETGTRLFSMELGVSGGGNMIDEFSVANGQPPVFVRGHISSGSANDKDFEIDTLRNSLYATAGGVYGITASDMTTGSSQFWPFGAAYGVATAHVPNQDFIYGASGSYYEPWIVRFSKETGEKNATFDLSATNGSGTILDRSIQVTPNGHIFFGRESGKLGLIGINTLGTLPTVANTIDAGPDRTLGPDEALKLPIGQWQRLSGLGDVTFTEAGGMVEATFQFAGDYLLEGSVSGARTQKDLLRVKVPPVKKPFVAVGASASYKAPTTSLDLSANGVLWYHPAFDDTAWAKGSSGFGYERRAAGTFDSEIVTPVGAAMYNQTPSLLMRWPFEFFAESSRIAAMELRIKIDDGFVAYLNGAEVMRFNAGNAAPNWNTTASSDTLDSQALIAQVFDLTAHAAKIRTGSNVLAIHALNDQINDEEMLASPELRIAVLETPYTVWSYAFSGFTGLAAAPTADPDGDGRPNFFEFATGSNPTVAESVSSMPNPRLFLVETAAGESRVRVVYARRKDSSEHGLSYTLLFSPDLSEGSWRYAGTVRYPTNIISVEPLANEAFELVTEELEIPPSATSTFARVDVSWDAHTAP